MRVHVEAVDYDYANNIGMVRGSLSATQVGQYHWEVFQSLQIPITSYGGTPLGFVAPVQAYCRYCDPEGSGFR